MATNTIVSGACGCSRRSFLGGSLGCGAYVALALAGAGTLTRRAFAAQGAGAAVVTEPFARVERIAEGVWAVVSTPAGGMQVVSNAGIIAGREGVLVVEGQNSEEGAAWVSAVAERLTGRRPTHVALTHFHADHSAGLGGHLGGSKPPALVGTQTTRGLLASRQGATPAGEGGAVVRAPRVVLPETVIVDGAARHEIDLGGRVVSLVCRDGHTPSDLTVEISDPRVVWCGDLVFNGLFPYFGDATPSRLWATCDALLRERGATFVPGHGAVTDAQGLEPYLGLLRDVEAAARRFVEAGVPASEAWQRYEPAGSLGEWAKFRPDVFRFAFEAWERELKPGR